MIVLPWVHFGSSVFTSQRSCVFVPRESFIAGRGRKPEKIQVASMMQSSNMISDTSTGENRPDGAVIDLQLGVQHSSDSDYLDLLVSGN